MSWTGNESLHNSLRRKKKKQELGALFGKGDPKKKKKKMLGCEGMEREQVTADVLNQAEL